MHKRKPNEWSSNESDKFFKEEEEDDENEKR